MAAAMETASSETSEPQTPSPADGSSPPAGTPETPQPTAEPPASEPDATETPDASEQRIRDLQSKWDSERSARMRAEQEAERLRAAAPPAPPQASQWEPKDFNELDAGIRERARQVLAEEQARVTATTAAEQAKVEAARTQVQSFFDEVKKVDSSFDPTAFSKWLDGKPFKMETIDDVRGSYGVYREVRTAAKEAEQRALKNKADRAADPVAKPAIGAGASSGPLSAEQYHRATSARDLLQYIHT